MSNGGEVRFRLGINGGAEVRSELAGVEDRLDRLTGSLSRTAHYGAGLALLLPMARDIARGFVEAGDGVTVLQNRLQLATGSAVQAGAAYDELFRIAQRGRVNFLELGNTYASISRAGQQLGLTQSRLLTVTEAIANSMAIGGGSAESMKAALVQLSQGLASGTLRGDELNSVMEQAPRLAQALADGLGVTTGQLRKLGEEGEITAAKVIGALEKSAPQLAKEMDAATLTVGQAFILLGNSMTRFIGEADRASGASSTLAGALKWLAGTVGDLGDIIAQHQTTFAVIAAGLAGAAAIAGVAALGSALVTVTGAITAMGVALAANPVVLALLGIGTAVGVSVAVAKSAAAIADALSGRNSPTAALVDGTSAVEDARLAAGTAAWKAREAAMASVAAIRAKLAGEEKDYVSTLQQLKAALDAGALSESDYTALVNQLIMTQTKAGEAAKKAAADHATLLKSYADLAAATALKLSDEGAELAAGRKLTDGERDYIKVMADVAAGKVKLNELIANGTLARLKDNIVRGAEVQQMEQAKKLQEEYAKAQDDKLKDALKESATLDEQIKKQREHNAAIGATVQQLAALERKKLDDAIATAEQRLQNALCQPVNEATLAAYQGQIDKLKTLRALKDEGVVQQASADAAKVAADEWKKAADSIYDGLVDSLYRAFESGKDFFSTFWSGIKNVFKTTVLRIAIQGVMSGTGLAGLLGAGSAPASTSAGGSGSLMGVAGQLGSLLGAGTSGLGSAFSSGLGLTMSGFGGTGLALEGAGAMMGSGSFLAGGAQALGAIAPYAAAAVAAAVLLKKAFGMGSKQTTATGISGTADAGGFDGVNFADWTKKGGWLRRDKNGSDTSPLSAEQATALNSTAGAVYAQAQAYAAALKLPAASLATVSTQIRVQLGADQAANEKAIAEAFEGYRDQLAARYSTLLEPLRKADETLTEAFARLAGLQTFSENLNTLGGVFSRVAGLSVDARENMIALAGGMDSLAAQAKSFAEQYYDRDELAGLKAREIRDVLAGAGVTTDVSSRAEFRALVESQDVATEQGRAQLATLLQVADSFAGLTDYLAETGKSLASTATQAPQADVLAPLFSNSAVQQVTAINAVRDSVDAVRDAVVALTEATAAAGGAPGGFVPSFTQNWEVSTGG